MRHEAATVGEDVNSELAHHWFITQQMAPSLRACTCICVHVKQHPWKSGEEKTNREMEEEKMTRDSGWRPHSGGCCCRVRAFRPSNSSLQTSCFGFYPAPGASGENRADLFSGTPGLQNTDSGRVVILVLAPLLLILLLSLVVERFNHDSTRRVYLKFVYSHIFLIQTCM